MIKWAAGLLFSVLLGACASRDLDGTSQALSNVTRTTFMHSAFGEGPTVFTGADGQLVEERRHEPFGVPIDARMRGDTSYEVSSPDLVARDLNPLNKRTELATGWSDHGARWMVPETARWLTTDPPVRGPDPGHMLTPWDLHPYQYVSQNPVMFWDPDGNEAKYKLPSTLLQKNPITWPTRVKLPLPHQRSLSFDLMVHDDVLPVLQGIFSNWKFEVSQVGFKFVDALKPYDRQPFMLTRWNEVRINRVQWDIYTDPVKRLGTMAHELCHSVQYRELGGETNDRALKEVGREDNYDTPEALLKTPIQDVNLTDKKYTLEQLCNRVKAEVHNTWLDRLNGWVYRPR